ncbi:hypothetical protein M011DRAFT_462429 [Sporormia fimetaria CBS 119925]|uniref:SMP-30/Gluconolactonase/LRE-like region domain-containing protein n=1 Tax=Sporormia fimetaria CBS 119925 TaxID=1340428 RepID=A0A6A6UW62_9PLEO|nr:hypothetical protein M011DRAFT_462429 [Sporormia fimetaria CBS 119925]
MGVSFIGALLSAALFVTPSSQYVLPRSAIRIQWEFRKPSWVENIAARANGDLLVTLLSAPGLHKIDPFNAPKQTLVHSFAETPGITGLLGITELDADVFAFIAGNTSQPGSYSVWKAEFQNAQSADASISKITDVPSAGLLNGITTLNPRTVLIADTNLGNVLRLDTRTGQSQVVIDDASMEGGINGVKLLGRYLYFTNSVTGKLHKVPINRRTGRATGAVETVASELTDADDFALHEDGTAYVARLSGNVIEKVAPDGTHEVFAGGQDSVGMAGPTALTFGRTSQDSNTLYLVTNGGLKHPVNGETVGGRVISITL